MFAYVTLGTNDLERAGKFYDALLAELGAGRTMEMPDKLIGWATGAGSPMLCAITPENGQPATVGNGVMAAIAAENPAAVDKLYAKAIELGGTDEGKPGVRAEAFYIAYFRDLDGNKLNFFCSNDA